MLKAMDALDKGFQETVKESDAKCKTELEELRKFIFDSRHFVKTYFASVDKKKMLNSLVSWCLINAVEECGTILFLARNMGVGSGFSCLF